MANRWGKNGNFIFLGSKITADGDCSHEIKRYLLLRKKSMTNLDSILKSRDITLPTKDPYSQSYGFSSSRVWMWQVDHKEGWVLKNRCFWTVVLERTLESPLDCKEIRPVNTKGNQPWIFIARADAEAPTLWPPDGKSCLIGKYPDVGKDWGQEEKGATEDEMVGWHHQLNGHESDLTPGDSEGQGSLWVCCSPWGHKELDTTEWLNNNICHLAEIGLDQLLVLDSTEPIRFFLLRTCDSWAVGSCVWLELRKYELEREKQKQTETKSLWQKREESERYREKQTWVSTWF